MMAIIEKKKGKLSKKEIWRGTGWHGMLVITEANIIFVGEIIDDDFGDWELTVGLKLYDRPSRSFYNQTRQSNEMKKAAIEDLIKAGMTINKESMLGSALDASAAKPLYSMFLPKEYIHYTIPLTDKCIEDGFLRDSKYLEWDISKLV